MSALARAYPNFFRFMKNPHVAVSKNWKVNQQLMHEARADFWSARYRLAYLRMATFSQRTAVAKKEFAQLGEKLANFGEIPAAEVGAGVLLAVECYLLFHVGEIVGKRSLIGYPVGPDGWFDGDGH
eukprot:g5584.t1